MKRTRQILSIFLSLCIAVSCMVGFSIPVNAATTDTITITANTNDGTYFRVSGTYEYKNETNYGMTDEFSTYAIITEDTPAEADTNPVTGVSAGFGLLAVCALTAGAALALKKRK
ncbi:MAG: hypothetical protein J6O50_07795 [Ruminiclostridium sp.]|nr:hypothetical protein [Ruminiclostridium sp.]